MSRIAVGAVAHETSTFTPVPTGWPEYQERFGYLQGAAILEKFADTNTPVGGFVAGAKEHGLELIPTVFARPQPSGPTVRAVFDRVLADLLDALVHASPLDGVLLELHGSMVVEHLDDADAHILEAVRRTVGPSVPVVAQLDIHANVSPRMVAAADVLVGRETYPEVDMASRGQECVQVLVRILRGEVRPTMALHLLPMIWGMNQVTAHSPMREVIDYLHEIERRPGVISASVATGYWLADVPEMGSSVYVATDGDASGAQALADELGEWINARRDDWQLALPSTRQALAEVREQGRYPAIFADLNDNTGGGAPGDSTGMLRTFVEEELAPACVLYMVDPASVARCHEAGVGTTIELAIGGVSAALQGPPCFLECRVICLSDGRFTYDGPMYAGLTGNMGPSAHVVSNGLHVIVVTHREQPFDTAFARSLHLEPRDMQYIGVKSAAHFRAGFESWAGAIYVVSEPGVHCQGSISYTRLGRRLFPIHRD